MNSTQMLKKRQPIQELVFAGDGSDFSGIYEAREWCSKNGYSYGSMARDMPIAMMKGDYQIAKWYNLSNQEQLDVDGIITGNFREGTVFITLYK